MDGMDENPFESPNVSDSRTTKIPYLRRRKWYGPAKNLWTGILWNLFGVVATVIFAESSGWVYWALRSPNHMPVWVLLASATGTILGFVGCVRYVGWYRSG